MSDEQKLRLIRKIVTYELGTDVVKKITMADKNTSFAALCAADDFVFELVGKIKDIFNHPGGENN